MKQPMYIRAATAISPQQSFEREHFLKPVMSTDTGRLYAVEASYAQYISPVAIRRMSRIMKMTISAAMQCLAEAGIKTPDAIITGTGRGGVTDMEVFVKDMIRLEEEALNPTAFIQSTYNSPNGWIAMQSGCTGYNQTYVHRGCSFELALLDARMLLAEAEAPQNVLAGCYDEMTEDYYRIRSARAYWKAEQLDSAKLLEHNHSEGTIGGEGAAFFILSNEPAHNAIAILDLHIIHSAAASSIDAAVQEMLTKNGLTKANISLVLTGLNGDATQTLLYGKVLTSTLEGLPVAGFKHLCGEYDTAGGFGLWIVHKLFQEGEVPPILLLSDEQLNLGKYILLINHYILGTASLVLIGKGIEASLTRF